MTKENKYILSANLFYERAAEFSAPMKTEYEVTAENEKEAVEYFLLNWENEVYFQLDKSSIKVRKAA